jgi:valyl-tRNA synthetase
MPLETTSTPPSLATSYTAANVEPEIYQFWEDNGLFQPENHPQLKEGATPFSLVIPPPNVTGTLHIGHALGNTLQDILVRWHRMQGKPTVWIPGTDHAGIATQNVLEKRLAAGQVEGFPEGTTKQSLGREAFLEQVWLWAKSCQGSIWTQFKKLGISPDWSRERFTLDAGLSKAVRETFVRLYNEGLIYRGRYIVNWDPVAQSAISDIETEYVEQEGFLWQLAYPLKEGSGHLVVATTRPETLYGDVAIAVHPEDERYKHLIGQTVILPLANREIPIVGDSYVDMAFGTGVLKITPAHDPNDFEIGRRHNLTPILVLDEQARLLPLDFIPSTLHGLERFEARKQTEALLEERGILVKKEAHTHRVGIAQRSGAVIEPLLSEQWFVRTKPLAEEALKAHETGEIRFIPERWSKDYLRWMTSIQDWCISRQLWWGHPVPAWYHNETGELYVGHEAPADAENWRPDPDVLDTWFSSGLWPFSTMGWPDTETADFKQFYPTSVLVTGFRHHFLLGRSYDDASAQAHGAIAFPYRIYSRFGA